MPGISNFLYIFFTILNLVGCTTKNVLFVISDDLRPMLGSYNTSIHSPNIDNLAKGGVLFKKAFAQLALCAPSRNSFLTSRRPDTIKLYDFYSYWRKSAGNFTTLPQYFKEHGYDTYSIGKVFHPGKSSNFTDDQEFSWSQCPWHPPSDVNTHSKICPTQGKLRNNVVCPVKLKDMPGHKLPDMESVREAIRYLNERKNKSQPFFLAVGLHKPHMPIMFPRHYLVNYPLDNITLPDVRQKPSGLPNVAWNPYNDLRERYDIRHLNVSFPYGPIPDSYAMKIRQSYFAAVTYIDDLFGKLITALKVNSLETNTVIVFFGDHGWSLGEHGEWAKFSNYEIALRVPLIIQVPNLTRGTISDDLVELLDLFPTIVQLVNLPPLPTCPRKSSAVQLCTEGVSLLPVILGQAVEEKEAFSQYPRPSVLPQKDSDRPRLKKIKIMGYSIRTRDHRYTIWVSWNHKKFEPDFDEIHGKELYDHISDPDENENLAGQTSFAEIEEELKTKLVNKFSKQR